MSVMMWHETDIPFCTNNEIHVQVAEVSAFAVSTFAYLPQETLHFLAASQLFACTTCLITTILKYKF
jgi:hypothetical protein